MSTNTLTIDTALAKRLVETSTLIGAAIIGQPGGWSVVLKFDKTEKTLGTQRTDKPRLWRSLDRCIVYLKSELNIVRFELLDATHHSEALLPGKGRVDTSQRMRDAHKAAAYDKWFREQVQTALADPAPGIPNAEVKQYFAEKREELRKRLLAG